MDMIPKRISRKIVYENEWVSLYIDRVQFASGYILDEHHLIHFDYESVAVVIQNDRNEILLIKSNRYTTQSEEWEIPAGRVDNGETSLKAAARETLEETGYLINPPELIYKYNPLNGISDKTVLIYKSTAIKKDGYPDSDEVSGMRWVSAEKITEMLRNNEIRCGVSLTGLALVLFCGL